MTINTASQFARNIRFLRVQSNLTQQELALALSMDRSTYSRLERGYVDPTLSCLILLAEYWCISLNALIFLDLTKN